MLVVEGPSSKMMSGWVSCPACAGARASCLAADAAAVWQGTLCMIRWTDELNTRLQIARPTSIPALSNLARHSMASVDAPIAATETLDWGGLVAVKNVSTLHLHMSVRLARGSLT